MGAISRIEAKGKVFISSADEKAQGDYADYNVDKKLIVLQGNVVLTQKESVLRCAKVTMQQDIGRSVCDPLPGQRVIGVFRQGG
jgi:lipopolysaccharide export system protein LptA